MKCLMKKCLECLEDFPQLLFASILGIAGGIYIYQPIFEQYSRDQKELKEKMKLVQDSEEKNS